MIYLRSGCCGVEPWKKEVALVSKPPNRANHWRQRTARNIIASLTETGSTCYKEIHRLPLIIVVIIIIITTTITAMLNIRRKMSACIY